MYDAEPIHHVNPSADWGTSLMRNSLCLDGLPVRTVMVGQFEQGYVALDANGKATFSVEIKLLRDRDRVGLSDMQSRFNPNSCRCSIPI